MRTLSAAGTKAADERGFTLIELLTVLVIVGILLTIAVPSFLGFKDRAQERTAAANVREAVPAAEAYFNDNQTYAAMNVAALQSIGHVDAGLTVFSDATHYCLSATKGPHIAKVAGPGGTVDETAAAGCSSATG